MRISFDPDTNTAPRLYRATRRAKSVETKAIGVVRSTHIPTPCSKGPVLLHVVEPHGMVLSWRKERNQGEMGLRWIWTVC